MNKNKIKIKYPKLFKLLRNIYLFFHPGVAVEEFFSGEVSSYEGFWIMQKKWFRLEQGAIKLKHLSCS